MNDLPPFLKKLYHILSDNSISNIISWEENGKTFKIHQPIEFSLNILPLYFKHNNFSSFVRQLNKYGFHKLNSDFWIFGNSNFRWGQFEKLSNIIRKKKSKLKNQVFGFESDRQKNFEFEIDLLNRYRTSMGKDIFEVCRRQEELISKQKYLEKELNHLKSFIFGYFSKLISSERDFSFQSNYFLLQNH